MNKLMKQVKTISAVLLLALFTTASISAQGQKHYKKMNIEMLQSKLDLTTEQVKEIEEIHKEIKMEIKTIKAEENSTKREKMAELRSSMDVRIDGILNPEQKVKFAEIRKEREVKQAERKEKMKQKREERKAASEEIRAYKKENVTPVLVAQRVKLDNSISNSDKLIIEKLREEHKSHRKSNKSHKKQLEKGENKQYKKDKRKGHHNKNGGDKWKKSNPESYEQARSLAVKYKEEIIALENEIAQEKKLWKEDMEAIKNKYKSDSTDDKQRATRKGKKKGKGKKAHNRHDRDEDKEQMKHIKFLLMNTKAENDNSEIRHSETKLASSSVYPNPSNSTHTISFSIIESGNVTIDMYDATGTKLKNVFSGFLNAGTHDLQVDLTSLSRGSYYYSIQDQKATNTLQFIKSK